MNNVYPINDMRKSILFILLTVISYGRLCGQTLTSTQKEKAESSVRNYFDLLSKYVAQPMGAEALNVRENIILMFENMYNAPVYNDLQALKQKTNLGASCTIDDYLLSVGVLNNTDGYTFKISYDSVVCQPLLEPSYAEGYNELNALVYVRKQIEGKDISEKITNVIRYNLNADKISYIEKASFSTNDEDVNFILKNHLGYSTAKLNELAGRCYREKKYTKAYRLYEQAAIRDDIDSQFALANMLYKRQGCEEYGELATKNMTKFWLKKIYFKYINNGVNLYRGIWEPVQDMMKLVFKDEPNLSPDNESKPFNSGLMRYKVPGQKRYGFINTQGEIVIPAIYESAEGFYEDLARVFSNGKWGYIDVKGKMVIPSIYEDAYDFMDGTTAVSVRDTIGDKSYKDFFIINKNGKRISESFDFIGYRRKKSEQLIVAQRGNKYGFINGLGKVKIPFIYDNFSYRFSFTSSISDHIISIQQNGKWGFIDVGFSEGKIIVSPQYKDVGNFAFGMAWVSDGTKYSFINKMGNIVCGGYEGCSDFNSTGLALVKYNKNSNDAYLINTRGEIIYYCNEEKGNLWNIRRNK